MTSIATPPKLQFFDANGNPLAGGKLYSYAAGTTTPLATYTNYGGGTANANPVVLDARGEANVWFGTGQYKLKLTDADDVEIWTVDNLNGPDAATLAALAASSGSSLIGYINSGAGAVARTVQDRLREKVSVKDFGAVGNGTANDTAAIQAAIDAAAARGNGGATVYFPAGTYRINSGITFTTGIILEGDSEKGTILKYYGSGSAIASTTPTVRTYYMGVTRMTVENTGAGGLIGLDLSGVNRSEFTQLQIKDFPTSVKITSPSIGGGNYAYALYNRFFNVLCEGETTKGFHLAGLSTNAHTFNSCQFNTSETASGAVGWYMENANGNQIMSCHADFGAGGSKFAVIYAAAGAGASDGNVFWGNRLESFYAPNQTYGFIINANVRHTVIGGNYYVSITEPLSDSGLGTVMLDPSWTVPGVSGYFPTTTSPTGQIVYKRDQSGQTFYPFMVLDDSQSGSGTPTTLQLITQRGTGYSLQVLRQGNNASISGITQANPCVITTTASHGITVGSRIALSSIGGMYQLNDTVQTVSAVTSTTLTLGSVNSTSYSAYTSGGTIVPQVTQFSLLGDGMINLQNISKAASSPVNNADYIGQLYVDTNANQAYISYRTGNGSGDWKQIT